MTTDDIINLAREAGFMQYMGVICIPNIEDLEHFVSLVAAAERERMIADGWSQGAQGNEVTQVNYEHYKIGLNPNREDGAWLTEDEALKNFAVHFCKAMSKAQGRMVYVRLKPELEQTRTFDEDMPVYRLVGRFSVELAPPVALRGDGANTYFGV